MRISKCGGSLCIRMFGHSLGSQRQCWGAGRALLRDNLVCNHVFGWDSGGGG